MSESVDTQPVGAPSLQAELAELGLARLPPDVQVYEITGPLFFGAIENIKRPLLEIRPYPKILIIRLNRVPFMDVSGLQMLEDTIKLLRKKGIAVMLCEANQRVRAKLHRAGVVAVASDPTCDRSLGDTLVRATLVNVS
jgi:sulfate permease, SulP family